MRYISMFSGIEAASAAWGPLGWSPAAFAEIDPFPCAVLAARYPDVPNLGDVGNVDWREYRGAVDVVVGGSPCQSFSVAGLRKGLADPRGNLMLEFLRACEAVEPEWVVWENVPGVLSSGGGRDFRAFLESVAQLWPRGGCAWRVLDAQFFGVAQRRRRVFAVVNTRDWRRAAAVLFEPDCLRGDNPTSREKRQELAARAGRRPEGSGGGGSFVVPIKGGTTPKVGKVGKDGDPAFTLRRGGEGGRHDAVCAVTQYGEEIAGTLTARHDSGPCADRGQNVVAGFRFNQGSAAHGIGYEEDQSPTLTADWHQPAVCLAVRTAQTGANGIGVSEDLAHAIDASGPEAVCFAQNQRDEVRLVGGDGSAAGALPAPRFGTGKGEPLVCVTDNGEDLAGTLCARDWKGIGNQDIGRGRLVCALDGRAAVRRLTPVECERLQGFPDGWTRVPYRGEGEGDCPDAPRYKAIGNSMAVPVMRWIGERIEMVGEILKEES